MSAPSRRRRARRGERGATVFVVVMAVTLLTAVGLFAAHSATVVDQAAGYARLARQTAHLAEYGTLAAAAELGSGAADPYLNQMKTGADVCPANAGRPAAACYRLFFSQIDARTSNSALGGERLIEDQSGAVANRLGTAASGVQGDFVVELTDPGPVGAPVAGDDIVSGPRYIKLTATTTAQLRPPGAACNAGIATLTGQQSVRAHLVVSVSH